MVKLIQKRNSCNLNHLASGIVTRIALVLCLENSLSPLINTRRKSTLKRCINCLVLHILVVAFYIAL